MTFSNNNEDSCFDNAQRKITLRNLVVPLAIGVLAEEKLAKQPVCFDVEINLGLQPIVPVVDRIDQVLDYRSIRDAVLQLGNQPHTELLETVLGKLCQQLQQLPDVIAINIDATKTQIFTDCQVALNLNWQR